MNGAKPKSKAIIFENEAKAKMVEGIKELAKAVGVTLGPNGNNVIIEIENSYPHITKDGVTVAESIFLEDKFKNLGCLLVRSVARKTAMEAGDGTTTATILTAKMVEEGLTALNNGANPVKVKRGMDKACDAVIKEITNNSIKLTKENTITTIKDVATISANNDEVIGKLIAEAIEKVGVEGLIESEPSKNTETTLEILPGLTIPVGMTSPQFANSEDGNCVFNDCLVLLSEYVIEDLNSIEGLLRFSVNANKPILLIAEDFSKNVVHDLLANRVKGNLVACTVRTPKFGEFYHLLDDIALITGATVISGKNDLTIATALPEALGKIKKVVIKKQSTEIIADVADAKKLEEAVTILRKEIDETKSKIQEEQFRARLARLTGGTAIIHLGANSSVELNQKKDRVDDAVEATKSSILMGISPGGGITYLKASPIIDELIKNTDSEDEITGMKLVQNALKVNVSHLSKSVGLEPNTVMKQILASKEEYYGMDFKKSEYGNMIKMGIVDPTKVLVVALQNSVSVSSMVLTTEAAIAIIDDLI